MINQDFGKILKTLEDQVNARIQEAKDKEIDHKAGVITRTLGETDERSIMRGASYQSKTLGIETYSVFGYEEFGHGTMISFKGKCVFDQGGQTVYSYIPGSWTKTIDRLYKTALKTSLRPTPLQQKRKQLQESSNRELRERFGL